MDSTMAEVDDIILSFLLVADTLTDIRVLSYHPQSSFFIHHQTCDQWFFPRRDGYSSGYSVASPAVLSSSYFFLLSMVVFG